ncbi:MAG: MerR family DNA-binding transcriptional regulator, partial [Clostridia bacterium]|nr:MerR family DNA-binding transcriptional regulator [Clostridia bacterium]
MFKIGEFSHLSKTTIKTLRYYDSIDLFKPSKVE